MSSYATPADLTTYNLPAQAVQSLTSQQIQTHLDAASDLADSYLSARYPSPLATWGPVLRVKVCEIAAIWVMSVVGFTPEATDQVLIMRYENAIRWFEQVRDGKITPPSTNTSPQPDPQGQVQQYVSQQNPPVALTPGGWSDTTQATTRPLRGW